MSSELMVIQQNVSFVNEGYSTLGATLKSRAAELSSSVQEVKEAQKETDNMMTWLEDKKKTAASWNNAATEKDSVKTQLEQQKVLVDAQLINYVHYDCFAVNEILILYDTQVENHRIQRMFLFSQVFEDDMKQKQEQLQKLRETLLNLIKTHPNSPEAAKWKQMLAEIGMHQGAVSRWLGVIYVTETVRGMLNPAVDKCISLLHWPLSTGFYKMTHVRC